MINENILDKKFQDYYSVKNYDISDSIENKILTTWMASKYFYAKKDENVLSGNENLLKLHENFSQKLLSHFLKNVNACPTIQKLHHNIKGKLNNGDVCKCSLISRNQGIHHNVFAGEDSVRDKRCNEFINNNELYCYSITIYPPTNFLNKDITVIQQNQQDYVFDGFFILTHFKIDKLPPVKFSRYNIDYTINFSEEPIPQVFVVKDLLLFEKFLFQCILELYDWDISVDSKEWDANQQTCNRLFHFIPKFIRNIEGNVQEILAMNAVLSYLISNFKPLFEEDNLNEIQNMNYYHWDRIVERVKNTIVCNPNLKPKSVRLDQIDRLESNTNIDMENESPYKYPEIVHIGITPVQSNYTGCPKYQKLWKQYLKLKHLVSNKAIMTAKDKRKLDQKKKELEEIKDALSINVRKYQTIAIDSQGYYTTGIKTDVVQYSMILPILTFHLRYHKSLLVLQNTIEYKFKDPSLLQKAMTHPSFKPNYGSNPDHCRNTLSNCGLRNPIYGDKAHKILASRKRGIITLNKIMKLKGDFSSGSSHPKTANYLSEHDIFDKSSLNKCYNQIINHNERLEFFGDAIIEFLTSVHLFFMFPHIEEGGLAVYRASLVQNSHLAILAKKLELDKYMLYVHGPDLCHQSDLNHAMSNAFEALLGAIFLDGSLSIVDDFLSKCLFGDEPKLYEVWTNLSKHPLQEDEPWGDRHWIPKVDLLEKLTGLEKEIGLEFKHIRLLARAFTLRNTGFNNLTLGHNQRLEFLGDTILQLITSEYLYKHFPYHHEGHLSLLRSCLVNNQTQCEVCNDLALHRFVISNIQPIDLTTKDKADLLESFLGALFVDQGVEDCKVIFKICFISKLDDFIENQGWNDPKSLLQQCCLTLRKMDGKEPDVPIYKVIDCIGPSNTRRYKVGVYFRNNRLSVGWGRSKQQAEMEAAEAAISKYKSVFPRFTHHKMKRQTL
ncbi:unnamed protein product [Gordionus sp. m RMFG-2023]|uniref:ribonuclease 3-like isoform X1 n=1 Tax=Gordionus sp. m RMFG-2023 TaxID=3053472 RepID=UPI0030E1CE59